MERMGYVLHSLGHVLGREMNQAFSVCGLTYVQARVLLFIAKHGEDGTACCQKDLERALDIQKSSVTSVLNLMERDGWMKRVTDEKDARRNRLVLTEKARHLQQMALECTHQEEQRLRSMLTEEEAERLSLLLNTLLARIKEGRPKNE